MSHTHYERRDIPTDRDTNEFLRNTAKSFNSSNQKLVGIKVDKHSNNPKQLCLKIRTLT